MGGHKRRFNDCLQQSKSLICWHLYLSGSVRNLTDSKVNLEQVNEVKSHPRSWQNCWKSHNRFTHWIVRCRSHLVTGVLDMAQENHLKIQVLSCLLIYFPKIGLVGALFEDFEYGRLKMTYRVHTLLNEHAAL